MWLAGIASSRKSLSRARGVRIAQACSLPTACVAFLAATRWVSITSGTQVSFRGLTAEGRSRADYNFCSDPSVACRFVGKMLKNLPGTLLAIVVLVPLGVLVLPLVYAMAWLLVLILPPICAMVTFRDAKANGELGDLKKTYSTLFLAVVVLPLGIMAFAAPLRVAMLAPLSFFPQVLAEFNAIHGFIYYPLIPVFGELFPYWLDFYWGILSLVTIFMIAFFNSIRRSSLVRQIEVLPTAKIRSVAIGLAELTGKAVPLKGQSTDEPIMRVWVESTGDGYTMRDKKDLFYLDDGTGRILVDPGGATINAERGTFGIALHQAILKQFTKKKSFPESRLMPGDTVHLVGSVQVNREGDAYEGEKVIVKPRKCSWLSLNFYDLFLISNIGEKALLDGLRKSYGRGWRNVLIGMAFGGWLSVFALTNIIQLEASSVEAAPEYYRLIATPTTLEREISVWKLGTYPTIYFVNMLRKGGDRAAADAIMMRFRELGLESLAIPILLEQAVNIKNPGFGAANAWLSRLDRLPKGLWGIEFFEARLIRESEAVVPRLQTRFDDNRLFVTFRAYVGERPPLKNDRIRDRRVVIELENKESGKKFIKFFDVDVGINEIDNEEAFEFLYPGTYKLEVDVERRYRSGRVFSGSRKLTRGEITLVE
ncbi:MAG: hypothetical protein BMS9Abin01_0215 [Gammaproteobacteria bacterium]|nr:MAG: hypothetical protein BMS9Abin01_0215 [Gammaproteobacteria bacterium]